MKKLISNQKAEKIQRLHTKEEIKNGPITLKRVRKDKIKELLKQKLLEEVNEYLFAKGKKQEDEELNDIIAVCWELGVGIDLYSKGFVLVNARKEVKKK